MQDYSNGKFYTIRSHQTEDVYIGSTTRPLAQRLGKHRASLKQYKAGNYGCMSSFEILKYDDHYIELLENYPCTDKSELERKEGEYIRSMECVNVQIAGRTMKEWYDDNRETYRQRDKQYYIDNREYKLQQGKHYYIDNKEQIIQKKKQYRIDNKERINKGRSIKYENNKEYYKKHMKQYRIANADTIRQKAKQYHKEHKDIRMCVCGGTYNIAITCHTKKHFNTNKHTNWVSDFYERLNDR